jgi:SAM-dependent methyltransferase
MEKRPVQHRHVALGLAAAAHVGGLASFDGNWKHYHHGRHRKAPRVNQPARVYDADARRLVYYGREADQSFWDEHWSGRLTEADIKRFNVDVVRWTRKFLPKGSKVLDAGCGTAHSVWSLRESGYDAWGIDFALDTVEAVKAAVPDLQVIQGDVRALPFDDSSLDGIWSLGVIEHFPEGYGKIIEEMGRALRPGAYAFVTFPAMSPLRRMKAAAGAFPKFSGGFENFYQFALDPGTVARDFEQRGFKVVISAPRGGLMGLKHEWPAARPLLQRFFDSRSSAVRLVRGALNRLLSPFSFHTRLLVLQRQPRAGEASN